MFTICRKYFKSSYNHCKKELLFLVFAGVVLSLSCDFKIQTEVNTEINFKTTSLNFDLRKKTYLSWSPDGKKIAYCYNRGATNLISYSLNSGMQQAIIGRVPVDIIDQMMYYDKTFALSPDGEKLVYRSYIDNLIRIYSIVDDSGFVLIPDHKDAKQPCWSSDGSFIVYNYLGNIWKIPSTGGQPILISHGYNFSHPSISPSGKEVAAHAYENGNYDIWIISVETGETRQLTTNLATDQNPNWSPDGSQIAFMSTRDDTTAIWLIPAKGGKATKLTKNFRRANYPAWSPDGSKIAFCTTHNRICVVSVPDGELIQAFYEQQGYPMWLPDGNSLILPDPVDFSIISTIAVETEKVTHLTTGFRQFDDKYPTWFFNNSNIAFVRLNDIWRVLSSTGGVSQLTNDSWPKYNLETSPNGELIAYDNGWDIFIIPVSGGEAINVTQNYYYISITQPTWSPERKQIACCVPNGLRIFSYTRDNLDEKEFVVGNFSNPSWSTNHPIFGSHIAVESDNSIYVISTEKLKPELVIRYGQFPAWAPDGIHLAYVKSDIIYVSEIFKEIE